MLMSPFDDPRSQPSSLPLIPNALQITTGFSLFLPHAGSSGVSPSIFLTSSSLGWELTLSLASRAAILASALPCISDYKDLGV